MIVHQDLKKIPVKLAEASKRDQPWVDHKLIDDAIQAVFLSSPLKKQQRRGERMCNCATNIIFKIMNDPENQELVHRLRYAEFCRVRLCSKCQWRKALSWRARFYQAWPLIEKHYPKARYFHLVLTVPNVEIQCLRDEIKKMNKAWKKMIDRKTWPALGFIRSVEVTRDRKGFAHPHMHCLMMVKPEYFSRYYMNREDWRDYWASGLGISSNSIIHPFVRAAKGVDGVSRAAMEVAKYAVKLKTMKGVCASKPGREWFLELDKQLESTKAVVLGGEIKRFVNDAEMSDKELLLQDKIETNQVLRDVRYDWFQDEKHYLRTKFLSAIETEWWNRQEQKWIESRS